MAKLLGQDLVTTEEFREFEENILDDLKVRIVIAENMAKSFKVACWIGGAAIVLNLGFVVYLICLMAR